MQQYCGAAVADSAHVHHTLQRPCLPASARVEDGRPGRHGSPSSQPKLPIKYTLQLMSLLLQLSARERNQPSSGKRAVGPSFLTDGVTFSKRRSVRAGGGHVPHAVQPVHQADVVEAGTVNPGLVMLLDPGKGVGGSRLPLEQLLEEAGDASSPERAKTAALCEERAGGWGRVGCSNVT